MITYVRGDATNPREGAPANIIVHVCNDRGGWGAGFVLAISKRWKEPERAYRSWFQKGSYAGPKGEIPFELGEVQMVEVDRRPILVANMIAQMGYGPSNDRQHRDSRVGAGEPDGDIPLRYDALESCLVKVAEVAKSYYAAIHMPRIGCGLAGGTWDKVGPVVEKTLADHEVIVYDFP